MDEYKQTPPAAAVHDSSTGKTPEGRFSYQRGDEDPRAQALGSRVNR
jgi:hypothetical protein